jgi:hypothetical protein
MSPNVSIASPLAYHEGVFGEHEFWAGMPGIQFFSSKKWRGQTWKKRELRFLGENCSFGAPIRLVCAEPCDGCGTLQREILSNITDHELNENGDLTQSMRD